MSHGLKRAERRPTDCRLLSLLEQARQHKMTPEEIRAQRRSWVAGELALEHDLTMEEAFRRVDAASDLAQP